MKNIKIIGYNPRIKINSQVDSLGRMLKSHRIEYDLLDCYRLI